MNRAMLLQIHKVLDSMEETHQQMEKKLNKKEIEAVLADLEQCQSAAITIGTSIEDVEGEGTETVGLLESYCDYLYNVHQELMAKNGVVSSKVYRTLSKSITRIRAKLSEEMPLKKEAVFLPYKASMWDSLESIWKKMKDDPNCNTKVIPIPYYDRNPDGSMGTLHYELNEYPEDVPVIRYDTYDLAANHPDEIYIHNPYDDFNRVTSVMPQFYSKNLKEVTDKLVYVPYFVLTEVDPNNHAAVEGMAHFVTTPGVVNATEVWVQSENMRLCYIRALVDYFGEQSRATWEQKIKASESPKFEKVMNTSRDSIALPDEWMEKIRTPEGGRKKVILYNTGIAALLQEDEKMIDKMESVFRVFYENRDRITLLWRPHPLIQATISSMRPWLWKRYCELVNKFRQEDWGIYDDSSDLDRAIVTADAYYGDQSSLVPLCQKVGMPIMIQNANILN